jgi:hypothetical protein
VRIWKKLVFRFRALFGKLILGVWSESRIVADSGFFFFFFFEMADSGFLGG